MKVVDIAGDIVFLCRQYGYGCNHTKVQKLLFLFVGFGLLNGVEPDEEILLTVDDKTTETMSIVDEQPKVWPYGPVFANVNAKYSEIQAEAWIDPYIMKIQDTKAKLILSETVRKYGIVESGHLSDWLVKPGSPWDSVRQMDGIGWHTEIPLDLIREYFDNNLENIIKNSTISPGSVIGKRAVGA